MMISPSFVDASSRRLGINPGVKGKGYPNKYFVSYGLNNIVIANLFVKPPISDPIIAIIKIIMTVSITVHHQKKNKIALSAILSEDYKNRKTSNF